MTAQGGRGTFDRRMGKFVPTKKLKALGKESKKSAKPHSGEEDDEEDKKGHGGDHDHEDDHDEPDGDEGKGGEGDGDGDEGGDEGDGGDGQASIDEMVTEAADRVDEGDTDQEVMDRVDGYSADVEDDDPPEWVKDEGKWNKAKEAVKKSGWEDHDEPWAVVAHVYKAMGGKLGK